MPRQLILHIGMHKTGTTAIQSALAGYDDGTTRMARLGVANHSIPMLTIYAADPTRYHVWVRQGMPAVEVLARRDAYRARLEQELALGRAQLVLSGEEMSLMHPASVAAMVADLAPRVDGIRALGWLRPAAQYAGSAFQQMVKAGQATPDLPRARYRDRFSPYLAALGRERLHLHLYDPARMAGESSVAAFCQALGLPQGRVADTSENTSISSDALRLVWALNGSGTPTTGSPARLLARSRLVRHLSGRHPGRLELPPDATAAGLDPDDIAWAEAETGLTLHDGWFPDPAAARRQLVDWLAAVSPDGLDRLDEDLQIIRRKVPVAAGMGERVAQLYSALLEEAEVEVALAPVFRAGNRDRNAGARGRT